MPHECLISKLRQVIDLDSVDLDILSSLPMRAVFVKKGATVQDEYGSRPELFIVQQGWLARSRILRDGSHRVIAFMIHGDVADPGRRPPRHADHTITAVTDAVVGRVATRDVLEATERSRTIAEALGACMLQDLAMMRDRIVSLGSQDGLGRLLALLWELQERLKLTEVCTGDRTGDRTGVHTGDHMDLPMGREWLAAALALSPRHLSRVVAEGRRLGLIDLGRSSVTFLDAPAIAERIGYDRLPLGPPAQTIGLPATVGLWSRMATKG